MDDQSSDLKVIEFSSGIIDGLFFPANHGYLAELQILLLNIETRYRLSMEARLQERQIRGECHVRTLLGNYKVAVLIKPNEDFRDFGITLENQHVGAATLTYFKEDIEHFHIHQKIDTSDFVMGIDLKLYLREITFDQLIEFATNNHGVALSIDIKELSLKEKNSYLSQFDFASKKFQHIIMIGTLDVRTRRDINTKGMDMHRPL